MNSGNQVLQEVRGIWFRYCHYNGVARCDLTHCDTQLMLSLLSSYLLLDVSSMFVPHPHPHSLKLATRRATIFHQ